MQDSGKPEDAGTAKPEGAGTEVTRETINRRQGNETEGQPEGSNPRQSRKVKGAERSATTPGGATGSAGSRGNPRRQRQWRRRIRTAGRPVDRLPAEPEDADAGATRWNIGRRNRRSGERGNLQSGPGSAKGCERRGNLKLGRRQSLRMQGAGQLATSLRGATGSAGPRGLSARRSEGCENRGNSKLHRGHSL